MAVNRGMFEQVRKVVKPGRRLEAYPHAKWVEFGAFQSLSGWNGDAFAYGAHAVPRVSYCRKYRDPISSLTLLSVRTSFMGCGRTRMSLETLIATRNCVWVHCSVLLGGRGVHGYMHAVWIPATTVHTVHGAGVRGFGQ